MTVGRGARWCALLGLLGAPACGGQAAAPVAPVWVAPPPLPDPFPPPADTLALPYLEDVYAQLRPGWRQFVEDCRLRLPPDDDLNDASLTAVVELRLTAAGELRHSAVVEASRSPAFDAAALEVVRDAAPLAGAPAIAVSDDELVHLRWRFARDRRGVGVATAQLDVERWPAARAVPALLARDQVVEAVRRVAAMATEDPGRPALLDAIASTELLRHLPQLEAGDATIAIGQLVALLTRQGPAPVDLHAILGNQAWRKRLDVRMAIAGLVALVDEDEAARIALESVRDWDISAVRVAARTAMWLGRRAELEQLVRGWMTAPIPNEARALAVLAEMPMPAYAAWLRRQVTAAATPADRAAACAALAAGGVATGSLKALRSATAAPSPIVRAAAVDALATDGSAATTRVLLRRLRDRDVSVRARAVSALADRPAARGALRTLDDTAVDLAVARATIWPRLELPADIVATYQHHADPAVRAAYLRAALGAGRAPAAALDAAIRDSAPAVRAAAVPGLDEAGLFVLIDDAVTEVRMAAFARLILHRETTGIDVLLTRVAAASTEERLRLLGVWAGRLVPR